MKKIFTLAAFAALCLAANGEKYLAVPEGSTAGTEVSIGTGSDPVCTFTDGTKMYFNGATAWSTKADYSADTKFTDFIGEEWPAAYVQGGTNGVACSLSKAGAESSHVRIDAATDGVAWFAAKYGSNKGLNAATLNTADFDDKYDITDMSWATFIAPYTTNASTVIYPFSTDGSGLVDSDCAGEIKHLSTTKDGTTANLFTAFPVQVKAGQTLLFWVEGSKIMLIGVNWVSGGKYYAPIMEGATPTAIAGVADAAAAPAKAVKAVKNGQIVVGNYNVLGQQVK